MADGESSETTTQLLRAWANGDRDALDRLTPRVYNRLRRIAGHCMRNERHGRTIQTTALVHEAYLKLVDVTNVDWQHRAHFFAVSATVMRRILLDRARRRVAEKRGGKAPRINLDEVPDLGSGRAHELIALDDALNDLAQIDPRKAQVIELRFFGGLSVEETAEVLKVSPDTVMRDWRLARARLLEELSKNRLVFGIRCRENRRIQAVSRDLIYPVISAKTFVLPWAPPESQPRRASGKHCWGPVSPTVSTDSKER